MRQQVRFAAAAAEPGRVQLRLFDHLGGRRQSGQPIGDDPAAVFFDADGNRVVALLVEVLKDGGGRGDRHFVLTRSPAVDDADAKFFHYLLIYRCG